MLKKKALNRIFITTVSVFIVFTVYTLSSKNNVTVYDESYHINESDKMAIYALNEENFLVKTSVYIDNNLTIIEKVKEMLQIIIVKNNKNALLPSDLKPVLPRNTKINDVKYSNNILKIYFSKELLNISEEQSEKMIEAIIYSLSEIDGILGIEIYVDNSLLKYVPNTKKELPTVLTTNFGINKVYNITSNKDINKVLLYYQWLNDSTYYVPVTNYINDNREKVEIIIESLSNFNNKNLISKVDGKIDLLSYNLNGNILSLVFNENFIENKDAVNVILYSIFNNYDIEKVEFLVDNNKILEKSRKNIE